MITVSKVVIGPKVGGGQVTMKCTIAEMQLLNLNGLLWRGFAGKLFTHVPLSQNSIIWYQPIGGDAWRLGK